MPENGVDLQILLTFCVQVNHTFFILNLINILIPLTTVINSEIYSIIFFTNNGIILNLIFKDMSVT